MERAKKRILITAGIIIAVALITLAVGAFIRGYRPNLRQGHLQATGVLAATSTPKGAQIWIDNKLKTATNQSINLTPGQYDIKIKKPAYSTWEKTITIRKEAVSETNARLFPLNPSLKALSFTGSLNPFLSPDGTKLIYFVPPQQKQNETSPTPTLDSDSAINSEEPSEESPVGIWLINLTEKPLAKSFQPQLLVKTQTTFPFQETEINWAPNSEKFLLSFPRGENNQLHFLIETSQTYDFTTPPFLGKSAPEVETILEDWAKKSQREQEQLIKKLPDKLQETIEKIGTNINFSPDEQKMLYQVSENARLPNQYLSKEVIGASTQPETRQLETDRYYVYDIKEDKNFLIGDNQTTQKISWFPTSAHLLLCEENAVKIIEYDGNNKTTIYSGPFTDNLVFPFPSGEQLLIFTSLNDSQQELPNLYSILLQ